MKSTVAALVAVVALSGCFKDETVAGYGGAGKIWRVTEIDGAQFTASATLAFSSAGRISGNAPCNSYSAEMKTPYPWFNVEAIQTTKQVCPDTGAENLFLAALSDMTLSEVLGDTLILSTPQGRTIILTADA